MEKMYWLTCNNTDCGYPIWLPLPIRHETPLRLLLWPTDGKPRNFLCHDCNHAYEYTQQDVQSVLHEIQNMRAVPRQRVNPDGVLLIEALCDENNCEAPVYILRPVLLGDTTVRPDNVRGVVSCTDGHLIQWVRPHKIVDCRLEHSLWE
jgi:hypothetical protein